MVSKRLKIALLVMVSIFSFQNDSFAEKEKIDSDVQLAMRMIGHQLLLSAGDSSSRVLPIQKDGNRYEIPFKVELDFSPDLLIYFVSENLKTLPNVTSYLTEVENCKNEEIVYTYKVGNTKESNILPCGGRTLPKDCYKIYITFLKDYNIDFVASHYNPSIPETNIEGSKDNTFLISLSIIAPILLIGFLVFGRNKPESPTNKVQVNPNLISIGQYQFDKGTLKLSINNDSVELTGKEADLLLLLHQNTNTTLEREQLLKEVWGDEGDYVGRTLDVFISKLRKRLKADENIKIVNVRGVGYRFVVETS